MKIDLDARVFSREEAANILGVMYRTYYGPDRQVDGEAQETLLPLLEHHGFLGLVRVLKIVIDSSEMQERVKSELSALWKEHFKRTPTEDEIKEYGPVLSCLREAGPAELLPRIHRARDIQDKANQFIDGGRPERAEQLIKSALGEVIPGSWEFWHNYGLSLKRQDKYEQAIPRYKQAIAYNEDDSWFWSCEDLRFCFENLGRQDRKWYVTGIEYFQPLTERRPSRWIAWHCLAWLTWQSSGPNEAIPIYREAIARQPNHGWHYSCDDLRACHEQTGHQAEALEYFTQMAHDRPDLWPAWHNQAFLVWRHKKDPGLAVAHYKEAIAHHPEGGWYWSWQDMGWCLMEGGRLDEAGVAFQRAKAIDPKSWHTWHALGNLAERRNRLDDAIGYYREALKLNPRSDWSWVGLGDCHHYASPACYALAWLAYQEALKVSPGLEQPRAEIEKIEAAGQPWAEILELLSTKATMDDLLAVCLKLQITYGELHGERLKGRSASLLGICRHEGRTGPLIRAIMEERPDLVPPLFGSVPQDTIGTGASTVGRSHLETRRQELRSRYAQLTRQVRNLDVDIGREVEEFRKQPLVDRRADLEAERTAVANQLGEIERQLAGFGLAPDA